MPNRSRREPAEPAHGLGPAARVAARLFLGVAMLGTGVMLTTNAALSLRVLAGLALVGLALTAIDRFMAASPAGWPARLVALLLMVLGVVGFIWRGTTVPFLAMTLAVALLAHGLTMLVDAVRGSRDRRLESFLVSAAFMAFGVLVLAWPKLSAFAVAALFGAWLIFVGARVVLTEFMARWSPERVTDPEKPARPHRSGLVVAVTALSVGLLALCATIWLRAGSPEIVPDAFYTPPIGVPAEAGAVIRLEPFRNGVPGDQQAWKVLYTTTTAHGQPAVGSGIVVAPAERPAALPLIAVAHGTTGVVPGCAPSVMPNPFADGNEHTLLKMIPHGWAGVLPDYVGLGTAGPHPYLIGPAEAHNVLDAIRAAHRMPALRLDNRTVIWGHSQGGHVALWTGMLAPAYAPEFDILGVAAMAPAANLVALAEGIKDLGVGKVVNAYIAASWSQVYGLDLSTLVSPGYVPVVKALSRECFTGRDALANVLTGTQLSGRVFRDEALAGRLGTLLAENTPSRPIAAPLLIAQGDADRLVLPGPQRQYVASRCAAGQQIDYREFSGLDHMPLVAPDSPLVPQVMAWTDGLLTGQPPINTCNARR